MPSAPAGLVVRPFTIDVQGCSRHVHPEVEATLVLRGRLRFQVGDGVVRAAAGATVLVPGGTVHETWAIGGTASVLTVQVPPDLGLAGAGGGAIRRELEALWRRSHGGLLVPGPFEPSLPGQLLATGAMDRFIAVLRLMQAIAHDPQARPVSGAALPHGGDPRLATALACIDQGLDRTLPISLVAREVGMGVPAFSRWFTASVGEGFRSHCARLRVARACRLLEADPGLPLATVVDRSGFTSLTAFHRWFRRITGVTPAAWGRTGV